MINEVKKVFGKYIAKDSKINAEMFFNTSENKGVKETWEPLKTAGTTKIFQWIKTQSPKCLWDNFFPSLWAKIVKNFQTFPSEQRGNVYLRNDEP